MSCPPLLALDDLRVTLDTPRGPVQALRGVSFAIDRGQTLGLIGESGCGKSLTALALMGLLPEGAQVTGSLRLNGRELLGQPEADWCSLRGNRLAMVFQEPMTALNPLHPIGAQIAEPLRLHQGLDAHAARAQALRLLQRVQLPQAASRLDAYPHQLSGGQRQRVVIAIALACGPDLLIADEPTTALDVTIQREVLDLINELVAEDGMGLLLISHDLGVMAETVQRMLVMYGGTVVESGPTDALFSRLAHPYTRGLFAARPRLGWRAEVPEDGQRGQRGRRGHRLPTIPGRVPELAELPSGCGFADRCALAIDDCRRTAPPAVEIAPGHAARCIRLAEAGGSA
jgi:peptide/nickel transport system ATP-binding protein